jgi:hypothetical protein
MKSDLDDFIDKSKKASTRVHEVDQEVSKLTPEVSKLTNQIHGDGTPGSPGLIGKAESVAKEVNAADDFVRAWKNLGKAQQENLIAFLRKGGEFDSLERKVGQLREGIFGPVSGDDADVSALQGDKLQQFVADKLGKSILIRNWPVCRSRLRHEGIVKLAQELAKTSNEVEQARIKAEMTALEDAELAIPNTNGRPSSAKRINFTVTDYGPAYITPGRDYWEFTAPREGIYQVAVGVYCNNKTDSQMQIDVLVYKNGKPVAPYLASSLLRSHESRILFGAVDVALEKTGAIDVRIGSNGNGAVLDSGTSNGTGVAIHLVGARR